MPVEAPPYTWCLPFFDSVMPNCARTICVAPQVEFRPKKLVIFETREWTTEYEYITTETKTSKGMWWWKRSGTETKNRQIEHKKEIIVPRNCWSVQTILVGQKVVFPLLAAINGEMFAPGGELVFPDIECPPSISIALSVKNVGRVAASFWGVVLGTRVEDERCGAKNDLNSRTCALPKGHDSAHASEGLSWHDDHVPKERGL